MYNSALSIPQKAHIIIQESLEGSITEAFTLIKGDKILKCGLFFKDNALLEHPRKKKKKKKVVLV